MFLPEAIVEKDWGREVWIHNSDKYCSKLLIFSEVGSHGSLHYHKLKTESWYVVRGSFKYRWASHMSGIIDIRILNQGDTVHIPAGTPHQLYALEDTSIISEASTQHFDDDTYRITRNLLPKGSVL
jgi:quercetin dioxygenase-like cupin family protein